ncbi:MAG: hypothetical protein R2838_12445 [Caldilineaceae bacterium]
MGSQQEDQQRQQHEHARDHLWTESAAYGSTSLTASCTRELTSDQKLRWGTGVESSSCGGG